MKMFHGNFVSILRQDDFVTGAWRERGWKYWNVGHTYTDLFYIVFTVQLILCTFIYIQSYLSRGNKIFERLFIWHNLVLQHNFHRGYWPRHSICLPFMFVFRRLDGVNCRNWFFFSRWNLLLIIDEFCKSFQYHPIEMIESSAYWIISFAFI